MTETPRSPIAREILAFWFGEDPDGPLHNQSRWFKRAEAFDAEIRARFGARLERAAAGAYRAWWAQPRSALAFVVLTDQFSRNVHRGSTRAYAQDPLALRCTSEGLARGLERALTPVERWFFYLPLMHAESLALQQRSLALFRALAAGGPPALRKTLQDVLGYAEAHHEVIARFGRFPHRNAALGRESTPEERAWLEAGGGF
jgi:uncharacterized protein (DUF924 family)